MATPTHRIILEVFLDPESSRIELDPVSKAEVLTEAMRDLFFDLDDMALSFIEIEEIE